MNLEAIKARFDQVAQQYDENRRKLIPCYDDFYGTSIDFLASMIAPPSSVLDLGAGTGLLTKRLYDLYPDAAYTLVDIAEEMLHVAKERFQGLNNFQFVVSDYSKNFPVQPFDLICSALSIHHLPDDSKQHLYKNIHDCLPSGGCFINLDQFNPDSPGMNEYFNQWWYRQLSQSALSHEEYAKWQKRRELDKENTIAETTAMLAQAGFGTVECIYHYWKFAVVLAIK